MNNEPLVRAIVSALSFLDEAEDDEVDPDAAVKAAEHIVHELLQMSDADRREFEQTVEAIAAASADKPAYAEYVRKLPFMVWGPESDE